MITAYVLAQFSAAASVETLSAIREIAGVKQAHFYGTDRPHRLR